MSVFMTSMNAKKHIVKLVFDWDDTLLASFYLSQKDYKLDTPWTDIDQQTKNLLKQLDQVVVAVLVKALSLGSVAIITNSETGWVALSAEKFLPQTSLMLPQLTIISARSTYEPIYPGKPKKWKKLAFIQLLTEFVYPLRAVKSLVGLGDNLIDREALFESTAQINSIYAKSIKFTESPSIIDILLQLKLAISSLDYICSHEGKLDLQLSVSPNTNATELPQKTTLITSGSNQIKYEMVPEEITIQSEHSLRSEGIRETEFTSLPPSYFSDNENNFPIEPPTEFTVEHPNECLIEHPNEYQIERPVAVRPIYPPGFDPIPSLNRPPTPLPIVNITQKQSKLSASQSLSMKSTDQHIKFANSNRIMKN
jgi:hypothetical protein